jgi:hypothetical protein
MNNADMPAMPMRKEDSVNWFQGDCVLAGLTKREHFAGLAMQGILSNPALINDLNVGAIDWVVKRANSVATEQLAELEKVKT